MKPCPTCGDDPDRECLQCDGVGKVSDSEDLEPLQIRIPFEIVITDNTPGLLSVDIIRPDFERRASLACGTIRYYPRGSSARYSNSYQINWKEITDAILASITQKLEG